jgi:hypothetical protein
MLMPHLHVKQTLVASNVSVHNVTDKHFINKISIMYGANDQNSLGSI